MAIPHKKFFEGQNPPKIEIYSQDNLDWYKEQLERCKNGFSYKGTTMTPDQYWFYNFQPMMVALFDKNGRPTGDFDMHWPFFSQDDDYVFKQIEEARQSGLDVMLMTGRGYGKTYIVISIGTKIFYLVKKSHGIISASGEDHANETWNKFRDAITAINGIHPTIAKGLVSDNPQLIASGYERLHPKKEIVITARMEKKVYDKKPGKTKGRRLNFQHFEEVGDWGGSATLKECIAASEGSWKVGSIRKARVFYTGTGGTILSDQAKEIFYNPDAYNLYKVRNWSDRGTAIMVPSYKKYGGYWEKDGVSDEDGAKKEIIRIRELKKSDPDPLAYNKFVQEYPFNPEELFTRIGGNRFPKNILAKNIAMLEEFPELRKGKFVNLHFRRSEGMIVGVDIEYSPSGKTWILEEPFRNENNVAWPRLYVAGYDGIDVGEGEAMTTMGSRGSLAVKKRLLPGAGISNAYVCFHVDRPYEVEQFYEECLKVMILFNLKNAVNIEDTKRGIIGFLKKHKAMDYLMRRPRLTLTDPTSEKESKLIGTTATNKNFEYGEGFLISHLKEYGEQLMYLPALHDLRDFSMDNRGKHDITVSMMMAELADDEFMDKMPSKPVEIMDEEEYGYYTDSKGKKRWGKIPKNNHGQFFPKAGHSYPDFLKDGKLVEKS
jgi:hypothetical protein